MYWTDYGTVPKILRASMDGTNMMIIHDTTITTPYCITIDYDDQKLYWADYTLNRIEVSNVDGTNRRIVTTSLINNVFSITFYNGRLFWTDLSYDRILTTDISSLPSVSTYLTSTIGDMYGIKAINEERQPHGIT